MYVHGIQFGSNSGVNCANTPRRDSNIPLSTFSLIFFYNFSMHVTDCVYLNAHSIVFHYGG